MLMFFLAFVLWAGVACAQDLPALFDVTGVASDDVLNVREGPGGSFATVGALAHDATGIEVLRAEGNWGLVNIEERTGWASLRFLARRAGFGDGVALRCYGTEPFWGLDVSPGTSARLTTPEIMDGAEYVIGPLRRAWNPLEKYVARGQGISILLAVAYCDDSMSDREFGLDVTVLLEDRNGSVYSGCCALSD